MMIICQYSVLFFSQELTKREVEYIALSCDTTESDLKQRREITAGSAYYVDQCAVRAATQGRVLILEGIEKAERNVLPVLNNLLENRWLCIECNIYCCGVESQCGSTSLSLLINESEWRWIVGVSYVGSGSFIRTSMQGQGTLKENWGKMQIMPNYKPRRVW